MIVVAAETNITIMRTKHEGPSSYGAGGASSLSLSAKPASDHGNLLLAVPRPRHLGVYHALPRSFSESDSRIRDVLSRGAHPLGYALSVPTRHHHLFSRRNLGKKSHESLRESA